WTAEVEILIRPLKVLTSPRIKPPAHYLTENLKTVVLSKVSRGRSTTDGKFGLLIESGKCCVSRQKPPKRGYWTPPPPVIEPSRPLAVSNWSPGSVVSTSIKRPDFGFS